MVMQILELSNYAKKTIHKYLFIKLKMVK